MIKKLIKNFRSIPSDIIKIIKNRNQIIYGNLPLYLKYKYFKEEWEGNKIDSMVYFNIVNYYIYDNNYIVDKLKSYWKK